MNQIDIRKQMFSTLHNVNRSALRNIFFKNFDKIIELGRISLWCILYGA